MRLRKVQFDRCTGPELHRTFTAAGYDLDLDTATGLIRIAPKGGEAWLVSIDGADMYPAEEPKSEPGPARPLPGRPRAR
jgi:hypothetical protein